jgi:PucR family transcriptional regulator, purine catabolism regulatory protein
MLTVRDMVDGTGVRVVAGAAGLDRPVRWVHISELADPTPWLSGGELLLTTGMNIDDGGAEYIDCLARHGLAGLGVGTAVGGLEVVPEEMAAEAERLGFPLFEVPYETPFIALTEKAFTEIVNEQAAMLQRAIAAHERLERIVLGEHGLEGIVAALAKLVDGGAAIFDARGVQLARRGLDDATVEGTAAELRRRGGGRGFTPTPRAIALPVPRTGTGETEQAGAQAWLLAARTEEPLRELDRLICHHAVTVVALELLRRRVADDTERRLAGDVLASLLSGELEGSELRRRLQPFGLEDRVSALVLSPPRHLKDAAEAALAHAARVEAGGGLAAGNGTLSCALLPVGGGDDDTFFALAERIRTTVSAEVGVELPAGAGRAVPAGEVRRGFHEARWALEAIALEANGHGRRLATYRDLGSFQLLLSLQDNDALRLFCDSILSPIETGEGAYGGELMRSLEVFIECNGQWERAAKQLFCHRHTLRYRIRRIEELTGRSLDSARDRIDFWLALRGRELLQ